jgi:hypothetical protein
MLLALPTNIKLGWERKAVSNTLAFYDKATITAVKTIIFYRHLWAAYFVAVTKKKKRFIIFCYLDPSQALLHLCV